MKRRIEHRRRAFGYPVYLPPYMQQELWKFRTEKPLPPSRDSPVEYRQKYHTQKCADQAYRPAVSLHDVEDDFASQEDERREYVEQVSRALPLIADARQRRIVELRFGLTGEPEMTLEQVGRIFKITRERVRQLEELVLAELRLILSSGCKNVAHGFEPRSAKWDWNDPKRPPGKKPKFKLRPADVKANSTKPRRRARSKRRRPDAGAPGAVLWEDEGAMRQTGVEHVHA